MLAQEYIRALGAPELHRRKRSDTTMTNAPFKLSKTPASNHLPSPLIGQHTREIVEGLLGYSREDLRAGFADGTFWPVKRARFPYMEEMLR
jgi:crotonobetainyl-CoA:carnitine CoA-transferase CaiB-like acyl-CoA transferase